MKQDPAASNTGNATTTEDTDEASLVGAAQIDPQAFGVLYHRYLERVYRYLCVHTPTAEDAADLTQQVFLRAFKALPSYRFEGAPFSAWLFAIARNLLTDSGRRRRVTLDWARLPETMQPRTDGDMDAALLRRETLQTLADLLAGLSSDKRELLALRFAARLTAHEISIIVGKSESAVQKQLERIIHDLKKSYGDWL